MAAMLLNEMEIFYHVVKQQSFSKAAERLKVSKSFISKRMTKLEKDLKARLILRSTRKLVLTDTGKSFYRYCENVVQEGEKGYAMINELQGRPSGLLKISIPPALALYLISPMLPKFLAQYPEVILDIKLENRLADIVTEGYDLALRFAKLENSNLIAQKIFSIENVICGTKKYLKNHDLLIKPVDLANHNCAVYSEAKKIDHLTLVNRQRHKETVRIKGNVMSNHLELIKQLFLSDACLGIFPKFMVTRELQNKKLIHCLEDHTLPAGDLYAIYPEREFVLPRFSHFLAMIKKSLQQR